MYYIKLFSLLREYLEKQIMVFDKELEQIYERELKYSEREKWNIETGRKFNDLISRYPVSEDELLEMSKVLCEYVLQTRITDIEKYFFINREKNSVRLPFMLDGLRLDQVNDIISDLAGEINIDEKGNNVLLGGSEDYENKWKYEIGENYGLQKAIRTIKEYCFEK